ncbi:hypothetical protein [Pedobacter metabolipauper]|uniref:Uncharacterized protein n=1 Tax=Pedobacter metabolipauper TaxID=425513 RepID=A0A4R6T4A4_9SPHI|nr:hypothetical protein [Pedobacter metabolipauper]TDQ12211.1 hypothetical protein ATK78_1345 [Pedobacter metabolipauper]
MTEVKFKTNSPELAAIIISILMEVDGAESKHPKWPECHVKQIAFVAEESGELVRAGNLLDEGQGSFEDIKTEAIHTAATAIRFLKNLPETQKAYSYPGIIEYFSNTEDEVRNG